MVHDVKVKEFKDLQENHMIESKTKNRFIKNPHLDELPEDFLFHLALSNKKDNLPLLFGDVKFVCMGGTVRRMKEFAKLLTKELAHNIQEEEPIDYTSAGHRYSMFKVGPVLCVNHGIGFPSITIVLHEVIKLLHHAKVKDPIIFRIGTCGGIGIPLGAVVIAEQTYNDFFEEFYEMAVLGKREKIPAILDKKLVSEIQNFATKKFDNIPILSGKVMSHEHFYEGIASFQATYCHRSESERKNYFERLKSNNILCLDMEAVAVAGLTHQLGIKSAVIFAVVDDVLHTLESDSADMMIEWQTRPLKIVIEYIKKHLENGISK